LNPKFQHLDWLVGSCFAKNIANGFHKLLPVDPIPKEDYGIMVLPFEPPSIS
jgi:hypothetical protein